MNLLNELSSDIAMAYVAERENFERADATHGAKVREFIARVQSIFTFDSPVATDRRIVSGNNGGTEIRIV
jgi:hypothetical protein